MIAALGLLVAAVQPPPAPQPAERPIIVTGSRIGDYRARLTACLARHCPVNEDVDATLALAEMLFTVGSYREARAEVQASIRRNAGQARTFPEPVSDLYRVHARVSRTLGDDTAASSSTRSILSALEAGLPIPDHRHFTAMFEMAELQLRLGHLESATARLRTLATLARRAGREDVAAQAETRILWYQWSANPRSDARRQIQALASSGDPARRMQVIYARIMMSRILRLEGHAEQAMRLLTGMGTGSAVRVLIHAPPYELRQQAVGAPETVDATSAGAFGNVLNRSTENLEAKWIDVGFWVTPEGQVAELEVLRRGASNEWAMPLLESVRGRAYSAAAQPTYRVERYTMTSPLEVQTGSRIPRHSPDGRVEYFDLTNGNAPPPPPTPAVESPPASPSPATGKAP